MFDTRTALARRLASRSAWILLVVGFYVVAAVVCTFPLVLHLADGMPPAPDTLLHTWILAWDVHALSTDPLHLYDANVYFPFPLSLTYSDAMLSGAVMVAPVLLITGNPVLAHNLLTLVSLVLAGFGMCLLVRALTSNGVGALVAGCVFAFCASRQAHLEHVNLLQFGWLPLALLCLHLAVRRQRTLDLVLLVLFTVCQALASVYLAWMMAIAYAIFLAIELAYRRSAWQRDSIARVAGALLLAAVIVGGVMWPYARMQQIYGFNWPADVINDLSATPTDYLAVPPQNILYAGLLARFAPVNFPTEHILFPGFVVVVLAGVALARRSFHLEVLRYALMGSVAFILSFGPSVGFDGQAGEIRLPYFYLLRFVPGFGVMRVPARFDFLVMLALAVLAGFGVARLSDALGRKIGPLPRRSILMAVVVATLLELLPRPQGNAPISVGAAVPPVYGWLRSQDPASVVAEIPTRGPTGFASFGYEYLSVYHWHPLVNGSSGFEPPASKPIAEQLDAFPSPSAVANLRSLGVRYVVAHLDDLDGAAAQRLSDADLDPLHLSIAATFGRDVVYELALPSSPQALRDHVHIELPQLVGRGQTPSVAVTITNDTPEPVFVGAPEAIGARVEWNRDGATQDVRQDLPVFFEPDRTLRLLFAAPLSSSSSSGDTAQLTFRLSGSVELEATQTVRISDLPTSLDKRGLAASIERIQLPPRVPPDAEIVIEVTARNAGEAIWLAEPPETTSAQGVVGVSIRSWTAADGSVSPPSEFSTAHVQGNVNPGQAAVLTIHTRTPRTPGRYSLLLDMLSESVTWFNDVNGRAQTLVPVEVGP